MATAPENVKPDSQKAVFTKLLEHEFGISATVGVGMQLLTAYATYQDINLDIQRFFDRKKEFESVQGVLNDIKPIKEQLEALGENADPGKLEQLYNQLCKKCGKNIATYEEAIKQMKSLDQQYGKLEKIFKDTNTMRAEADKILQQRRTLTIFQLFVTYGRLMTSCYRLRQNSKALETVEKELNDIKIKYLQPILKQVESLHFFNINDNNNDTADTTDNDVKNDSNNSNNSNNNSASEQKLMRRIGFVKGRLEALKITIAKQSQIAKSERWVSSVEGILSGFNFIGSVVQINSLTNIASKTQIAIQTGIAALQGTAAVGHAMAAVYAHFNVLEWEKIDNEVSMILARVDQLESELLE